MHIYFEGQHVGNWNANIPQGFRVIHIPLMEVPSFSATPGNALANVSHDTIEMQVATISQRQVLPSSSTNDAAERVIEGWMNEFGKPSSPVQMNKRHEDRNFELYGEFRVLKINSLDDYEKVFDQDQFEPVNTDHSRWINA